MSNKKKYSVRINSVFDLRQVMKIYKQEKWLAGDKEDMAKLKKMIKESYAFACLYHEGKIIGIGRAASDGVSDAYIHDVAVLGEYRGRGIGEKIVRALLKNLRSKGVDWIVLIAQPGTKEFWRKLGFSSMKGHVPMKFKV